MVLRLLKKDEVALRLQKCALFINKINALGHIFPFGRLEETSRNAEAISEQNAPTKVSELRFVLGLWNVFRRSVPNFTRSASCLSRRFKKNTVKRTSALLWKISFWLELPWSKSLYHRWYSPCQAEWTLHLKYKCMWQTNRTSFSTGPERRENTLTDRIYGHETSTNKEDQTLRMFYSSLFYYFKSSILRRCRFYNTYGPPHTLLNTEPRSCDW